jgi:putative transposase
VTCRVLGVRRQGYYEWRSGVKSPRALENELLVKHIEKIHAESRYTYGWPRVHAELTLGLGFAVNHKRVARLMREAGIQGLYRRRKHGCTARDPHADPYDDLVDRDFVVDAPDELWMTDITEHPTDEGKVYCAAVLDAYSRRIVGWSIDDNMRTALVVDALGMAIIRRRPEPHSAILHSDHGSQFTSWAFGKRLTDSPWVWWRPGLWDFDRLAVVPLGSVERLLELGRWPVAEVAVQARGVVPVHPAQRGEFDVLDGLPWLLPGGPADQLGLVVAVDRLGQGVVVGVTDRADRRDCADLGEPLAIAHRCELRPGIRVTPQPLQRGAAGPAAISMASSTMVVRMCAATRHPTIIREKASTMKHT